MRTIRLGGWWRLWIVASATYGASVAVFTWSTFPAGVETISYQESHLKLLSDRALLILGGRVQPSIPADSPKWARAPIVLEMPNGHRFEVVGNTTSGQTKEFAKDYLRLLNSILAQRRLSAVQTAFLAWVIPCLLALVLAWAAAWIYRGFKQGSNEP